MTDKQIIIDGCDVSGCEYYDKNKPLLTCVCEEYPCSECHNCYYKQLKRKEQECGELKENLSDLKKDLKFQNDKISEIELDLQNANNTIENCLTLISRPYHFRLLDEDIAIFEEYDKQRQAIVNQYLIEYYKMFDKTILSGMSIEKLKKFIELINEVIADKISECEGNDER